MPEPRADRPNMPDGYLGTAPLSWRWAEERLTAARTYWVTTVGAGGRPHVRPVWAIWLDDSVQFSTGARHAANIARDPRTTVNIEGDDCVILEGDAAAVTNERARAAFCEVYQEKYQWEMTLAFADVIYVVQPKVVHGWIATEVARETTLFQATATRWTFD